MSRSLVQVMRRAMLPLDGSIADHVPAIVEAYARLVPRSHWPQLTVIDLTAGSCLLPLLFAANGVRRLVINDVAARTYLAASALFGGRPLDLERVRQLAATPAPRLRPHTPSFHFAADYLTEDVADTFDRLYYARMRAADLPVYQYLALRWVLGFVPSPEHEFEVLPTHEYDQLARERHHDWSRYIDRSRRKLSVLDTLARAINAAIARVGTHRAEVHQADLLTLCRDLEYDCPVFVIANPPTRGIDEYTIDDQLVHSLLANRWLPLTRSRETPVEFWVKRVSAALSRLPVGGHSLVWGGDGSLRWEQCLRVWRRYAVPVAVRRVGRSRNAPGWAIVEKRL